MYLGRIVEIADRDDLYRKPAASLHRGADGGGAGRRSRGRSAPAARGHLGRGAERAAAAAGLRFHTRCPRAMARCKTDQPPLREIGPGRAVACHLHT